MRLTRDYFERDTLTVAKELIGTVLFRQTPQGTVAGCIVETEAYLGERDPAAHSYKGKRDRTAVLYGDKACAYVYLIYGMYHCLNLTSGDTGLPECVLIRALEPIEGLPLMRARRGKVADKGLCNGPGKLCQALALTREQNGTDLIRTDGGLWIESGTPLATVASPRVNIDYAGDASLWPWRFTAENSPFISRKP